MYFSGNFLQNIQNKTKHKTYRTKQNIKHTEQNKTQNVQNNHLFFLFYKEETPKCVIYYKTTRILKLDPVATLLPQSNKGKLKIF